LGPRLKSTNIHTCARLPMEFSLISWARGEYNLFSLIPMLILFLGAPSNGILEGRENQVTK